MPIPSTITKYKMMIRRSEKDSEISLSPDTGVHAASVIHTFIRASSSARALYFTSQSASSSTYLPQNPAIQRSIDSSWCFKNLFHLNPLLPRPSLRERFLILSHQLLTLPHLWIPLVAGRFCLKREIV